MPVSDWYTCDLTARYAETDRMGVIYHANYLTWFEIGRTEMIRELGYPYRKIEEQGLLLPLWIWICSLSSLHIMMIGSGSLPGSQILRIYV